MPTLRWARTAAARIGAVRTGRGGVELLREEAYVTLDDATREPTKIDARSDTSANLLIERLMVASNEAVARWMFDRGLPGVYRVHDEPEPERVHALAESARHFGFELGLADRLTPRGLAALDAQFATSAVGPAMRTVLQRVLGPARYTVHPSLHYGLAAPLYLHFTSPIRRYADLAVHRVVKAFLAGQRAFHPREPAIEALAQDLNEQNRRASKAEAERLRMLAARLFTTRVGERFRGNVVAVKPFGLIVQLAGLGVSGTVQADSLPGGPFEIDRRGALVGRSGAGWSIGQPLDVEIVGASEELGRIDLAVAG
jgi:ribonuclease R